MKKIFLILFLFISLTLPTCAKDVIYKTTDGTVLKCTYKMTEGSIQEYQKGTPYYYTFKDGKLYSRSFFEMFASSWRQQYKKDIPHVMFLKIKDDKITFREYCSVDTGTVSKKSTIDRKTGEYTFKSERLYHWSGETFYHKKAKGVGKCVIVK